MSIGSYLWTSASRAGRSRGWRVETQPDELTEGLFGQVVLWVMQVLPYLRERGIYPTWRIRSKLYGSAPEHTVLPGAFELAYEAPATIDRTVSLLELRRRRLHALGADWAHAHGLWHAYFRVPPGILQRADAVDLPERTLGLHYRGRDKLTSAWDTNPVSQEEFVELAHAFLCERPPVDAVFVATDEHDVVAKIRDRFSRHTVVHLGPVEHHKDPPRSPRESRDRAVLDCVLLSRCRSVLKCSSALSAFAKVLNPDLEIYRVAASKLFAPFPYFPAAYIPRVELSSSRARALLERTFLGDWLECDWARKRYATPFASMPRGGLRERLRRSREWVRRRRRRVLRHLQGPRRLDR